MWKFFAIHKGETREIEGVVLTGLPSAQADFVAARDRLPEGLHRYFKGEIDLGPNGTRDAIQFWAELVNSDWLSLSQTSAGRVQTLDGNIISLMVRHEGDDEERLTAFAWHDHTSFLLPLTGQEEAVVIEYTREPEDSKRAWELINRHGGAGKRLETLLDFRAFHGTECAVVDGIARMWASGTRFVVKLSGNAVALVGSVLRVVSEIQPAIEYDPLHGKRLASMQAKFPAVAAGCPSFSTLTKPIKAEAAIAFVHGTASCGLAGLSDICCDGFKPHHIYRYEHDTFRPVRENGEELAKYVMQYLDVERLLIVAHSRGGLVGRRALKQLAKRGYPAAVTLHTFGTPHNGTPVVKVAGKALSLLYKAGEYTAGLVPALDPLTKAIAFLIDPPQLPPGIDIMRVDSDARALLDDEDLAGRARCTGATFKPDGPDPGYGFSANSFLSGIFLNEPNDLIVPTASTLGFGEAQPILDCAHSGYFRQPAVRDLIHGFVPPETLSPPPDPPPARPSYRDGDHHVFGSLRLPIRK